MDSQQKFTGVISSITISHYADIYLDEEWDDLRWYIIDTLATVPPDEHAPSTKLYGFVIECEDQNYYFATTIVYETPRDVVVYDVFEIDQDMFLDFVTDGMWIKPYC